MEQKSGKFVRRIGKVLYVVRVRPAEHAREGFDGKLREMMVSRMARERDTHDVDADA